MWQMIVGEAEDPVYLTIQLDICSNIFLWVPQNVM